MSNRSSFWKNVLQNTISNVLAGLVLIFIGKLVADHWFERKMTEMRRAAAQVPEMREQVDKLGQSVRELIMREDERKQGGR